MAKGQSYPGKSNPNYRHGHGEKGKESPEYIAWLAMKSRCSNPNSIDFHNYGGRGITVCEEWVESFAAFFQHVGPKPSQSHTLDRVNNDGHYEPGNVRWATKKQQCRNTRWNRLLTHNGQTKSLAQWADDLGLNYFTLHGRLKYMPPERALTRALFNIRKKVN